MSDSNYILACDERGTTRWPHISKTWAIGGFIIGKSEIQTTISIWENIKLQLCCDKHIELKWSHFFPGHHQQASKNPLISQDPIEWRQQAMWALTKLFSSSLIIPITTVVRKDRASNELFKEIKETGIKILDRDLLWLGIVGQYATFLKHRDAQGEIWFDHLGSSHEEERWQKDWDRLRNEPWPINTQHQETLKRISPTLTFFDSELEPLIQIADFVSGVIWAAAEGDDEFLIIAFKDFFPWSKNSYTFMSFI